MCGDRFSSSTTCSRWRHETEPGRLDQSLSCRFWKVATHPSGVERSRRIIPNSAYRNPSAWQREMVDTPQGQGGLDGEIRVPPLPTSPATPAGRPGSDRVRGQPHRHIAAANEGLVIGRPVRHAVLRLVRGMDLRLHSCSVAPAKGHEKCAPYATTPARVVEGL